MAAYRDFSGGHVSVRHMRGSAVNRAGTVENAVGFAAAVALMREVAFQTNIRSAQHQVLGGFQPYALFRPGRDLAFRFHFRIALDFGDELVGLAVVPDFGAVLVHDVIMRGRLVGGRGLCGVMRAEHYPGFHALTREQTGHRLADVRQALRLVFQASPLQHAQRRGHHAVAVLQLDTGRTVGRVHTGDSAETQGCPPVGFQRGHPPLQCRKVEHAALNRPARGALPPTCCSRCRFCVRPC